MTEKQKLIIQLLRMAVVGDVIDPKTFANVDWMSLMEELANQTVLGFVWGGIEANPIIVSQLSIDDKLEFYGQTRKIVECNKGVNKALSEIVSTLNGAGINSILLKGQGCASFYPNPLYRSSGDIDLLVGKDNFYKAQKCLKDAGLVGDWIHEDIMHGMLSCGGTTLELHKYPAFLMSKKTDDKFQEIIRKNIQQEYSLCPKIQVNGTDVSLLPIELNTVFTFFHMFKHFVGSGIKIRQVIDWLVMCKAINDKQLVARYVRDFGIEHGWKVFAQMAVELIGVPAEQVPLYEPHYSTKSEQVLQMLLNGDMLDLTTEENPSLWKRVRYATRLYLAHLRNIGVFPKESLLMIGVLFRINAGKYLFGKMK